MTPQPQVSVSADGPYHVTGGLPVRRRSPLATALGEPIAWQVGDEVEAGEEMWLCRCGQSAKKPFCDGSHSSHTWDPTLTAPPSTYAERSKDLGGDGVTVRDDRSLCEHAGFCGTKATNVWKMAAARGDTALTSQMLAMVGRCPSGALTATTDAGASLEPDLPQAVGLVPDGPLLLTGGVRIVRPDGTAEEVRNRVTLCRCGASANKPYCDGSHAKVGFSDQP